MWNTKQTLQTMIYTDTHGQILFSFTSFNSTNIGWVPTTSRYLD